MLKKTVNLSKPLKWLLAVVVLILAGYLGFASWNFWKSDSKLSTNNRNARLSTTPTPIKITSINQEISWLVPPVKLGDLKLFKANENIVVEDTNYYKIATIDDGSELILALVPSPGPGSTPIYKIRFKKKAGKYYYLEKCSEKVYLENNLKTIQTILTNPNQVDEKTTYDGLASPEKIKVKGADLTLGVSPIIFFSDLKKLHFIEESNDGQIYQTIDPVYLSETQESKNFAIRAIYLKHADSTINVYETIPSNVTESGVPQFNLLDGKPNTDQYFSTNITGCGGHSGSEILLNPANITSRLVPYGRMPSGEQIYRIKSSNDPILAEAYTDYKQYYSESGVSKEVYLTQKPLIIWQDQLGDYEVFAKEGFQPEAGCGKPVIYLYPNTETRVSVKLGVTLTKSEPIYNKGWKVIAKPSGKLIVDGKEYPYLFWEGIGNGKYPAVNFGKIVRKEELKSILLADLSKLGLSEKERADFMDFWWPKMPNTPYTRLTWLNTEQMDNLAPLYVTPKPDTKIRVFLDYEGLSSRIDIKPQNLYSPKRQGFTLVEWGGILRGNLNK